MPTLLSSRPAPVVEAPARSGRRFPVRLFVAGAGLAVLVPVGVKVASWLPDTPFEQQVTDRSTTPLLLALDDLHEYHAATADLQVMLDVEVDIPWVPSFISGERVHFLAGGTVDAYVDFEGLGDGAVTLSPDGNSATITLPAPELSDVRIDAEQSRVVDRDRGLVERLGDAPPPGPPGAAPAGGVEQRQVLRTGQVPVVRRPLDQRADPGQHTTAGPRHARPQQLDRPAGEQHEAEQHAHGRRLPRAVGAEEPVDVAAADVEVDPVDRAQRPERLGDAGEAQNRLGHAGRRRPTGQPRARLAAVIRSSA